jgi:hypothetical protein
MLLCHCRCAHFLPLSNLIRCHSTAVNKRQAEATTADYKKQADVTMMGTTVTDDDQPAAAGKGVIWQCGPIGPPNLAAL